MADTQYTAQQQVEVYDVGKKRWYKATTLWCVLFDPDNQREGWECQLRNGNRGSFDQDHIRAV